MTDTLQSLPGKWRKRVMFAVGKRDRSISDEARTEIQGCADELEAALAASGREAVHHPAADVVVFQYRNILSDQWCDTDEWHYKSCVDSSTHEGRRLIVHPEDRTATTEGSE